MSENSDTLIMRVWAKPLGKVTSLIILALLLCSIFASQVSPFDPDGIDTDHIFARPGMVHFFGSDDLGRDLLSRIIFGGRIALTMAFCSAAIAMIVGVV